MNLFLFGVLAIPCVLGINHVCPSGLFQCDRSSTCCQLFDKTYGCCPVKDAVCCKDGVHCCPSGTKCNLTEQTCDGDESVTPMYDSSKTLLKAIVESRILEASSIVCPGSSFKCPDGSTCCRMPGGGWGCCPYPHAYCCADGIHCCPIYMYCDDSSQFCHHGLHNVSASEKKPATRIAADSNIVCPDKSRCQDGMTCCLVSDSQYGCCPYANATCCSDRLHCCPSGNICDVKNKQCIPQENWILNLI